MVQLDYDEEVGPCHGMYGSMEAEVEGRRIIKRAEADGPFYVCFLKRVIGPTKVHVDNKRIMDGLPKGQGNCIKSRAGDADLLIKIWEELHRLAKKEALGWQWSM